MSRSRRVRRQRSIVCVSSRGGSDCSHGHGGCSAWRCSSVQVVATGQAIRATKAERLAEKQMQIAQEQQRLAKEQTQMARKKKQLAEDAAQRGARLAHCRGSRPQTVVAVTDFLVEILRSPDPERDGRTITVVELLDRAKAEGGDRVQRRTDCSRRNLFGALGQTYWASD